MELICTLEVVNRRGGVIENLSRGSITVTRRNENSTPPEEPFIIVRTSSDNTGTKYKLIGNIEGLTIEHHEFFNERQMTVLLEEPSYNIIITYADVNELKAFIIYVKEQFPKDSPLHVPMAAFKPPTDSIKMYFGGQEKYKLWMENIIRRNINLDRFTYLNISNCILELEGYQLPIVDAIRKMKNLTALELEDIELRSSTFLEIESKELKQLHLCCCKTRLPITSLFKNDLCYKDSLVELRLDANLWLYVPNGIFQFQNLLKLSLSGNCITELPDNFTNLSKLQELELNHNRLTHLPPSIFALQNLSKFQLVNNHISELPNMFAHLSKLQVLSLSNNQLRHLPPSIFALQNLSELSLSSNLISELPDMFTNLPKLETLELDFNQLRYVPSSIFELQNLSYLSLSRNLITDLPDMFTNLSKLKHLLLFRNQLQYLPPSICSLHLTHLDIGNNALIFEIPPSFGSELIVHSLKELSYRAILNHKLKVKEGMLPKKFLKDLENHHHCVCGCKYVDEGQDLLFLCNLNDILSFTCYIISSHLRFPVRGKMCNSLKSCFLDRFTKC